MRLHSQNTLSCFIATYHSSCEFFRLSGAVWRHNARAKHFGPCKAFRLILNVNTAQVVGVECGGTRKRRDTAKAKTESSPHSTQQSLCQSPQLKSCSSIPSACLHEQKVNNLERHQRNAQEKTESFVNLVGKTDAVQTTTFFDRT
jgi:hypothetical protein